MAIKVMRCEERNTFMGDLIKLGLGTNEVESFIVKQESLMRGMVGNILGSRECQEILEREREMVNNAMKNKLTDSLGECVKKNLELINLKKRLWWRIKSEGEKVYIQVKRHNKHTEETIKEGP